MDAPLEMNTRSGARSRRIAFLLFALVLIPSLGIIYLLGTPLLEEVSPGANESDVPANAPLRLTFSRQMDDASVRERLTIEPAVEGSFSWDGSTLVFTPSVLWPSGASVRMHLASGARASGLLSLPMREEANWSFSIRSPRLLYLFPADGPAQIMLMDLKSGESSRLTEHAGGVMEFHAGANGEPITYSARNEDGGSNLYRLTLPTGSREAQKTTGPVPAPELLLDCGPALCLAPQVSPDGGLLAYEETTPASNEGPNYPRVWLLPMPVSEAVGVAPRLAGDPSHQTTQPSWSSHGLLAFHDADESITVILDPATGETLHFPNATGQPGAWDPTGQVYLTTEVTVIQLDSPDIRTDASISTSHLIRFDLSTRKTENLSQAENLDDSSPIFSPDGRWLIFARRFLDLASWTPGRQIWMLRVGDPGFEPRPLTNDPYYNHAEFTWSPDGKQLAYVRFNQTVLTEPPELWWIDPQAALSRKLVVGGYAPLWIP